MIRVRAEVLRCSTGRLNGTTRLGIGMRRAVGLS